MTLEEPVTANCGSTRGAPDSIKHRRKPRLDYVLSGRSGRSSGDSEFLVQVLGFLSREPFANAEKTLIYETLKLRTEEGARGRTEIEDENEDENAPRDPAFFNLGLV